MRRREGATAKEEEEEKDREIAGEEEDAAVRRGKRRNDESLPPLLPPFTDGDEVNHRVPRIRRSHWGERVTAFRARVRAGVAGWVERFETIWFDRALGRVD
ncbi:hypothetical protein B296_00053765 [Ensete ventricosum]|uniref:Uncharacterized protein n=1 Tax=Ensete ventricosum TaxID=4639 RepID=A0A426XSL0_ENSVE|nr:hypothetical protein B296_00053765 [Ensete ventricosum]